MNNYEYIIDNRDNSRHSIFSERGKFLLKSYVKTYKNGGMGFFSKPITFLKNFVKPPPKVEEILDPIKEPTEYIYFCKNIPDNGVFCSQSEIDGVAPGYFDCIEGEWCEKNVEKSNSTDSEMVLEDDDVDPLSTEKVKKQLRDAEIFNNNTKKIENVFEEMGKGLDDGEFDEELQSLKSDGLLDDSDFEALTTTESSKIIKVEPSYYDEAKMKGKEGDFLWEIKKTIKDGSVPETLYIFNDNDNHHYTTIKGKGNGQIRIYNREAQDKPNSAGISTGKDVGFKDLNDDEEVKRIIHRDILEILDILSTGNYDKVKYSKESPDNITLGTGIFDVNDDVLEYITELINMLPELVEHTSSSVRKDIINFYKNGKDGVKNGNFHTLDDEIFLISSDLIKGGELTWVCGICTYLNENTTRKACEICSESKAFSNVFRREDAANEYINKMEEEETWAEGLLEYDAVNKIYNKILTLYNCDENVAYDEKEKNCPKEWNVSRYPEGTAEDAPTEGDIFIYRINGNHYNPGNPTGHYYGSKNRRVPGDGNCFFTSIAAELNRINLMEYIKNMDTKIGGMSSDEASTYFYKCENTEIDGNSGTACYPSDEKDGEAYVCEGDKCAFETDEQKTNRINDKRMERINLIHINGINNHFSQGLELASRKRNHDNSSYVPKDKDEKLNDRINKNFPNAENLKKRIIYSLENYSKYKGEDGADEFYENLRKDIKHYVKAKKNKNGADLEFQVRADMVERGIEIYFKN